MADEMQVSLPEGVLRPIIQAQIVAALQGQDRLIQEMVTFVLKQTVRDQKTYKDLPFLEWVCRQQLEAAITSAVQAFVAAKADAIKDAVAKQMKTQVNRIASELVASMTENAGKTWRLGVTVKLGNE